MLTMPQISVNYKTGRWLSVINVPVSFLTILFILYGAMCFINDFNDMVANDVVYKSGIALLCFISLILNFLYHKIGFGVIDTVLEKRVWITGIITSAVWLFIWAITINMLSILSYLMMVYSLIFIFYTVRSLMNFCKL